VIRTDSMGHSGCHEQDAHPIIDTTNFVTQILTLTDSSGFTELDVTSLSLPWNVPNEDACILSNVNQLTENTLTVYPNPSSDFLNLYFNQTPGKNSTLCMFDLSGKIVFKNNLLQQRMNIDIRQFASGIYFLKYEDGENVFVKKVVLY